MTALDFIKKCWRRIFPIVHYRLGKYIITLDAREAIQNAISWGDFEPTETKWVKACLKPGDVFVDAGANVGYYSLIASQIVGEKGTVYAFEPSPCAYNSLEQTIRVNGIDNIVLSNYGLSDREETMNLLLRDSGLHSPSFHYNKNYTTFSLGKSVLTTLDKFARQNGIGIIDLVKIDVEGSELKVIKGMAELLGEHRIKRIMIEYNGTWLQMAGTSMEEIDTIIKSHKFVVDSISKFDVMPEELPITNCLYRRT